jgi:hypothetical protein
MGVFDTLKKSLGVSGNKKSTTGHTLGGEKCNTTSQSSCKCQHYWYMCSNC